jgi:hypothetical protein
MNQHPALLGVSALLANFTASALLAQTLGTGVPAGSQSQQLVSRQSDGHPDLNGTWDNGSGIDFLHPEHLAGGSVCVAGCDAPAPVAKNGSPAPAAARAPRHFPKYRPQFLQQVSDLEKNQLQVDPVLHCRSPGLPRIGPPDKIVQQPGQIVFLYDDVSGNFFRIIPTDGRPHRTDVDPSTLGDSVGHWDGDTLVVEANQFNDESWLTDNGAFHSSELVVTERLQRVGKTLHYESVSTDPKVLAEPWKVSRVAQLTDVDLIEAAPCIDKDLNHVVDGTHHDNPR